MYWIYSLVFNYKSCLFFFVFFLLFILLTLTSCYFNMVCNEKFNSDKQNSIKHQHQVINVIVY